MGKFEEEVTLLKGEMAGKDEAVEASKQAFAVQLMGGLGKSIDKEMNPTFWYKVKRFLKTISANFNRINTN
jgi:hypothetical protein